MKLRVVIPSLVGGIVIAFCCFKFASKLTGKLPQDPAVSHGPTEGFGGHILQSAPSPETADIKYLNKWDELPAWAVQYGGEFWRKPSSASPKVTRAPESSEPALNVGEAVSRVSHAFLRGKTGETASAKARSFAVEFANGAFSLSPHRFIGAEDDPGLNDPLLAGQTSKIAHYAPDPETKVEFKTLRVRAGGNELYAGDAAAWRVVGNTAQGLLNATAGLVEHYEVRPDGVEVSWVLQRPCGGDLLIEAQLTGLAHAGEDVEMESHSSATNRTVQSGRSAGAQRTIQYFADANGERRVQVGAVVLVDSRGQRSAVPTEWAGNTMRLQVPGTTLAQLSYPIAIDPLIGPAFAMMFAPQPFAQVRSSIAWNGTYYLFVWEDYNPDGISNDWIGIRGTIVKSNGTVLTPGGFTIRDAHLTPEPNRCRLPAAGSRNGEFLVVWADSRAHPLDDGNDLYGARVTETGTVLNPNGVLIANLPEVFDSELGYYTDLQRIQDSPRIASVGNTYLVVWPQHRIDPTCGGCHSVAGVLINQVGLSPWFYVYTDEFGLEGAPDVCTDGVDYLVAWQHYGAAGLGTASRVITTTGAMGAVHAIPNVVAHRVASASAAGNFMVIDSVLETGSPPFVKGVRFKKDGTILDQTPITIAVGGLGADVASDGTNYYVAYFSNYGGLEVWNEGNIHGKRIRGSTGAILDTDLHLVSCTSRPWASDTLEVICNGREYMVSWTDGAPSVPDYYITNDVWATRVSLTNQPIVCFPVSVTSISFALQNIPSVAHNPGNGTYFVAWLDYRNGGNSDIYGVQLNQRGMPLQPSGVAVCTASGQQGLPYVAALSPPQNDLAGIGHGYFVTWGDGRSGVNQVYGARIASTGSVVDPNGFSISTGWSGSPLVTGSQERPCAYALGEDILVAWQGANPTQFRTICAARLSANGPQVYLNRFFVHENTTSEFNIAPRIAGLGTNYMVVWMRYWSGSASASYDIAFSRVSTNGTVVDSPPGLVSNSLRSDQYPKITADATTARYLVTWMGLVNSTYKVFAGVVQEDGLLVTPADGIQLCNAAGNQRYPSVAALPLYTSEFLIAWQDYRSGSADIYGARMDLSAAQILDPTGFIIDSSEAAQEYVELAAAPDRCLAIFRSLETGTAQVQGRFVFPTPTVNSSAIFSHVDSTTGGYWVGTYGSQGTNVIGDTPNYPPYFSSFITQAQTWHWPDDWPSVTPVGLQKPSNPSVTERWCVYSQDFVKNGYFDVDLNFTDTQTHQVAFYVFDYDVLYGATPRVQSITLLDAQTGLELDTRTEGSFSNGKYYVYNIKGHVTARFTLVGTGKNAVMSGFFID